MSSSTSAALSGSEIAAVGFMAALALVIFLSFQEVTATGDSLLLRRLSGTANTVVAPLLLTVAATVAIRVAAIL